MARKTSNHRFDLPPLELKCMKALWGLGEGSVEEIRSRLASERSFAYTTIMTVMDRLARKRIVEREKRGRAHFYRPLVREERVRERALDRLVENFFRGSRGQLRHYLKRGAAGGTTRESAERSPSPPREPKLAAVGQSAGRAGVGGEIDPSLL